MDVFHEIVVTFILQLAGLGVAKDKKEMGWVRIHEKFRLLPRCPVHDTVIVIFFFIFLEKKKKGTRSHV